VEYGTTISTNKNNVLIQYSGIGNKTNFICSVTTLACEKTKKFTLGGEKISIIKSDLKKELLEKKAEHLTLSPAEDFLAYYLSPEKGNNISSFVIKDIKQNKDYRLDETRSYWDLVVDLNKIYEFSPDNKLLVYLDDNDGYMSLYKVETNNLVNSKINSSKISTSAFTINDFIFYDSQTIYYIGNSKNNPYQWSLYQLNLKTGEDKVIENDVSYVDRLRKVGSVIVFNGLQNIGYGPKIYNPKSKRVSNFRIPNINTKKSTSNEEVVTIGNMSGVLMPPKQIRKDKSYPLIIWLHGGPVRQTSINYHPYHSYGVYDSILKLFPKNNFLVLKLDYRGSIGFGRIYSESIKESVGKGDVLDVLNSIDYIKNKYKVSKVYLMGNSYGGYLSLKSLVERPDVFDGVVSINGVTDWESLVVKMQNSIFNTEFNGLPDVNNRALYDQASIYNKINNIGNQKIEIIAGVADRTIPYWQATDLYNKLKSNNKDVKLISYKGEGHVYRNRKTIKNLCNELFKFVEVKVDPECNR
jgi:dipeptidyl aminopeptidase/acylaminoacyl peptidase